jgi:hypothetical protein
MSWAQSPCCISHICSASVLCCITCAQPELSATGMTSHRCCTNVVSPWCVIGDAISDTPICWMPCHILHKSTSSSLWASVGVPLVTSYYIGSSHTHHRWSNSTVCVCVCGFMWDAAVSESFCCKLHTCSASTGLICKEMPYHMSQSWGFLPVWTIL